MGYVRKINVELIGATGLKNSEYFGKSDPYVILSIGTTEFRSKTAEDQPTAPVWNEKFVIPALESDAELLIRILNENVMATDDEMGRVIIPLAQYRHGETGSTFTLQCPGEAQGELKMNLAFENEDDHESQVLVEKIEDLSVGGEEHHDEESVKEDAEEKIDELKEESEETNEEAKEAKEGAEELKEEKAEEAQEQEAIEANIVEVQETAEEKEKKHKHHHRHHHHHVHRHHHHHKHHKKSDEEGSSSSSGSESDKEKGSRSHRGLLGFGSESGREKGSRSHRGLLGFGSGSDRGLLGFKF